MNGDMIDTFTDEDGNLVHTVNGVPQCTEDAVGRGLCNEVPYFRPYVKLGTTGRYLRLVATLDFQTI